MRARMLAIMFAAAALVVSTGARAVSSTLVAGPGSFATTWSTPFVVAESGDRPVLQNLDAAFHGLESVSSGSDDATWCGTYDNGDCPLFWADTVPPFTGTTEILGLGSVAPGTYAFHCPVFEDMRGLLVVLG